MKLPDHPPKRALSTNTQGSLWRLIFARVLEWFKRKPSAEVLAETLYVGQQEKLKELKRFISKTQYLENVGNLGERAADQLKQSSERFQKFEALLLLKFSPQELTYTRYHSAGGDAFLALLDSLNRVATTLYSLNAVDLKKLEERLKELNTISATERSRAELESLEERKVLREQQVVKITELLAMNEKALTEFDRVSLALSDIQTRKGETNVGLDAALAELSELANRAKKYTVS